VSKIVLIKKGKEYIEKHTIKDKTVKRRAYINKNGVLVEEWDIPAGINPDEVIKYFKKVKKA